MIYSAGIGAKPPTELAACPRGRTTSDGEGNEDIQNPFDIRTSTERRI
jgi:hypothetical protein